MNTKTVGQCIAFDIMGFSAITQVAFKPIGNLEDAYIIAVRLTNYGSVLGKNVEWLLGGHTLEEERSQYLERVGAFVVAGCPKTMDRV